MKRSKRAIELQKAYIREQESKDVKPEKNYKHYDRLKHMSWCLKNDIKIYIVPKNYRHGRVIVEEKGRIIQELGPYILNEEYMKDSDVRYWNVIYKLYTEIYETKIGNNNK